MNDDRHAAFGHTFNSITLYGAMVHRVEISEIDFGRSWNLQ